MSRPRLSKSCRDRDFIESLVNHWINLGVEKEVRAALQPVEERLELQEKELHQKINSLVREIEEMKEVVNIHPEAFLALPEPQAQHYQQVERGDRQQVIRTKIPAGRIYVPQLGKS